MRKNYKFFSCARNSIFVYQSVNCTARIKAFRKLKLLFNTMFHDNCNIWMLEKVVFIFPNF